MSLYADDVPKTKASVRDVQREGRHVNEALFKRDRPLMRQAPKSNPEGRDLTSPPVRADIDLGRINKSFARNPSLESIADSNKAAAEALLEELRRSSQVSRIRIEAVKELESPASLELHQESWTQWFWAIVGIALAAAAASALVTILLLGALSWTLGLFLGAFCVGTATTSVGSIVSAKERLRDG